MLELAGADRFVREPSRELDVESALELRLIDADGRVRLLSMDGRRSGGMRATATWHSIAPAAGVSYGHEVELSIVAYAAQDGLGLQIVLPLGDQATRFMIPGLIYGENRLAHSRIRFPRVSADGLTRDALTADHWAFRTDRAPYGAVIGWTPSACFALAVEETCALGTTGVGFRGGADSALVVNFPAREEPVTYVGHDAPAAPEVLTHDWQAGEIVTLRFAILALPPDLHAYNTIQRWLYRRDRPEHQLRPWMSVDEAAALTAHGLHRWHYRSASRTLAETVAFHRESNESAPVTGDREEMHVAWLSGAPTALALLTYGREQGIAEYVDAAISVLDTVAGGLAPCGAFWGRWTPDGWDGGWNGHRDRIHARTIAEATLFMDRALRAEHARGVEHPPWRDAIASNLSYALASQRDDGAFPALINGKTGAAESWDGAAGFLWIPALLEADLEGTLGTAENAGSYYARFVEDEFIYGAAEDIDLSPSSEDGYNAVMAYVALYEATRQSRWLELARRAADWMLSFRWSYNLAFPQHTMLESYDYRSRGADLASPRNQHLHGYGLICLPEMIRLAALADDDYYLQRSRDNLACFLQFVAREDGDFNARKGMVSERYYNSRCFGPKGAILPVSHAWSAGLVLYACQSGLSVDA